MRSGRARTELSNRRIDPGRRKAVPYPHTCRICCQARVWGFDCCDDSPDVHDTVNMYLQEEGMAFSSAYSGTEALRMFERVQLVLMLLDIMMSEMLGTLLLKCPLM
ncbi:response regulator [Paenibacillus sp. S-38]|uniref:response regulator n=1 Tax=Paenibacillus sp. S-38 TaxID=3416710 RepID=UPI003CE67F0F